MHSARSLISRHRVWFVGGVTLVLFLAITAISKSAESTAGPGIMSFEFVGSAERAARFMEGWGASGQRSIEISLWIDFVFMVFYAWWFILLLGSTARRFRESGRGAVAAWGDRLSLFPAVAAGFDAIEGIGLLAILYGNTSDVSAVVSTTAAALKFALLAVVVAYLLYGELILLFDRRGRQKQTLGT